MSKYKVTNGINIFVKILSAIIVILLILGIVGGIVYLLNRPKGLFIEYNGTVYGNTAIGSSTGGLSVPYDSTVTFTIGNLDGLGRVFCAGLYGKDNSERGRNARF